MCRVSSTEVYSIEYPEIATPRIAANSLKRQQNDEVNRFGRGMFRKSAGLVTVNPIMSLAPQANSTLSYHAVKQTSTRSATARMWRRPERGTPAKRGQECRRCVRETEIRHYVHYGVCGDTKNNGRKMLKIQTFGYLGEHKCLKGMG